jgi:hypothetical protein
VSTHSNRCTPSRGGRQIQRWPVGQLHNTQTPGTARRFPMPHERCPTGLCVRPGLLPGEETVITNRAAGSARFTFAGRHEQKPSLLIGAEDARPLRRGGGGSCAGRTDASAARTRGRSRLRESLQILENSSAASRRRDRGHSETRRQSRRSSPACVPNVYPTPTNASFQDR